jgi:N6-adenosine-specific RNA methylase IME4
VSVVLPSVHGGYGCILADPPWKFDAYSGDGGTPHRTSEDHYPTMLLADMMALPVSDVAAKDAALFMWVVDSHLVQAVDLAAAWGFAFKTVGFCWIKQKLINADQIDLFTGDIAAPRMGFGYWSRKQMELCLLFTRGSPRRLGQGVRQIISCPPAAEGGLSRPQAGAAAHEHNQIILAPRREHSRKPDCQYERIETLVGGPRLELFSRTTRAGWDAWGNDVGRFGAAEVAA